MPLRQTVESRQNQPSIATGSQSLFFRLRCSLENQISPLCSVRLRPSNESAMSKNIATSAQSEAHSKPVEKEAQKTKEPKYWLGHWGTEASGNNELVNRVILSQNKSASGSSCATEWETLEVEWISVLKDEEQTALSSTLVVNHQVQHPKNNRESVRADSWTLIQEQVNDHYLQAQQHLHTFNSDFQEEMVEATDVHEPVPMMALLTKPEQLIVQQTTITEYEATVSLFEEFSTTETRNESVKKVDELQTTKGSKVSSPDCGSAEFTDAATTMLQPDELRKITPNVILSHQVEQQINIIQSIPELYSNLISEHVDENYILLEQSLVPLKTQQ
ncbi:hypothetical protein BOX15_Mlig022173g1, partial [Macrostomum lignano]